jgi:hypothetical protein
MAKELIFLTDGDARAERVVEVFAQSTGLTIEPIDDGAKLALRGTDHRVKVVETLTDIDPNWSDYLALGAPEAAAD